MLVLARKVGQQIVIGDQIEITVLEVRGEQVRLGIAADRSISIHRKELLTQVAEENARAAEVSEEGLSQAADALTGRDSGTPQTPQEAQTPQETEKELEPSAEPETAA